MIIMFLLNIYFYQRRQISLSSAPEIPSKKVYTQISSSISPLLFISFITSVTLPISKSSNTIRYITNLTTPAALYRLLLAKFPILESCDIPCFYVSLTWCLKTRSSANCVAQIFKPFPLELVVCFQTQAINQLVKCGFLQQTDLHCIDYQRKKISRSLIFSFGPLFQTMLRLF